MRQVGSAARSSGSRPTGETAGADDAARAAWIPADSYAALVAALNTQYGGTIFASHVDILRGSL